MSPGDRPGIARGKWRGLVLENCFDARVGVCELFRWTLLGPGVEVGLRNGHGGRLEKVLAQCRFDLCE